MAYIYPNWGSSSSYSSEYTITTSGTSWPTLVPQWTIAGELPTNLQTGAPAVVDSTPELTWLKGRVEDMTKAALADVLRAA